MKRALKFIGLLVVLLATTAVFLVILIFFFPSPFFTPRTLAWTTDWVRSVGVGLHYQSGKWSVSRSSLMEREVSLSFGKLCVEMPPVMGGCFDKIEARIGLNLLRFSIIVRNLQIDGGSVSVTPTKGETSEVASDADAPWFELPLWSRRVRVDRIAMARMKFQLHGTTPLAVLFSANADADGLVLSANSEKLPSGVPRLQLEKCRVLPLFRLSSASLSLDCSVNSDLPLDSLTGDLKRILRGELGNKRLFPLSFQLKGVVKFPLPLRPSSHLEGHLSAVVTRFLAKSVEADASVTLQLDPTIPVSKLLESTREKSRAVVDLKLRIPEFKNVVARLHDTRFAVPAPFHVLDGEWNLAIHGTGSMGEKLIDLSFFVDALLSGREQRLAFGADGHTSLFFGDKGHGEFDLDVKVADSRLILPVLNINDLPRFIPDNRIVFRSLSDEARRLRSASASSFKFSYQIHVATEPGVSLNLYTNVIKKDISLGINFTINNHDGVVGTVQMRPIDFPLLKRKVKIHKLRLVFNRQADLEIDAALEVVYVDYAVSLLANGLVGHPRFTFFSDPPLPESSVISLLLFGRPIEELNSGENETINNSRAALSNAAVSALSMYFLASTPVESVVYDPLEKRFSANIRLGDGTSLRLQNTVAGAKGIGIRKRLGRDWVINTFVEKPPASDADNSVSAFLEWNRRY